MMGYRGNGHDDYGWNDYLVDFKSGIVVRAQFYGSYANDPDRLAALENAEAYFEARDVGEWQYCSETYPVHQLEAEKLTKYENEDVPIRAHILDKSLTNLMKLAGAPDAMIADFALLMSAFTPAGAQGYGRVQEKLIDNPDASMTEISRLSEFDRSTIYAQFRKGGLRQPEKQEPGTATKLGKKHRRRPS